MLFIIGLGLNENGISREGMQILEKCKKIYLEGYTVDFPYKFDDLNLGKKKIIKLGRSEVESDRLLKEAKSTSVALLVYGSPLFATTHISLILDAEKEGVKTKIIYSASIFDAIAETGLQLYKFGKTTSMPIWTEKYKPDFLQYVKENKNINAHSLILIDIGLKFENALKQLEENAEKEGVKFEKILICSSLGTDKARIYYSDFENLRKKNAKAPFCFIIPGELHFLEKEAVERFA